MRSSELSRLECGTSTLRDVADHLVAAAAGRRVLNVGAAGGWKGYLDGNTGAWLHHRMAGVAETLVGIDIDAAGVEAACAAGYDLRVADCQTDRLAEQYDLIVLSDVIEHLERPGDALGNLAAHLAPGGYIAVTTPNATFVGNIVNSLSRRPPDVYWDHVALYAPEHLHVLCTRRGLRLRHVHFFTFLDRRTRANAGKSAVIRAMASASPRLHGHFLAEVQPDVP